ncbi:MAG: restriction endonuclease subunit S [Bacteroidetes bacterium]|nr:restriction endonuclease subunit S [Bacteroidota bacterium]
MKQAAIKNKGIEDRKSISNSTIPNDWEISTVGDAFEICNNLRYPISEAERRKIQGNYPYYGPTKIQDFINEYRLDGKYSLIGEDGDHFLKWKDLPMTLLVDGKFNVNNHAHVIKGTKNITEWFFYYFNHKELTPYLTRQGAGRYKLTKQSLEKIPVPLPPYSEQQSIVRILKACDNVIEATKKLIAQKGLRKKWLMQQLLTGKKRLKGFGGTLKKNRLGDFLIERNQN